MCKIYKQNIEKREVIDYYHYHWGRYFLLLKCTRYNEK
ncbi:hypothetical protein CLB_2142 [Clostridium botulinum A str. ATCC 19397]|nr:hypothetical protein CLB_2142 [Clostridium botulinum A str. ATCC 19397]